MAASDPNRDDGTPDFEGLRHDGFLRRSIHDLNNALCAVTMNAGLLREAVEEGGSTSELLDDIADAAHRAAILGKQLRRFVVTMQPVRARRDPEVGPAGGADAA